MFAIEECEFFTVAKKLDNPPEEKSEQKLLCEEFCDNDEIDEERFIQLFLEEEEKSKNHELDENDIYIKEEKAIEIDLQKNNYQDIYYEDISSYEYTKKEILSFCFKNKLVKSHSEIKNFRIGHFSGYKAILILMNKFIKQFPGTSKTFSTNALGVIFNLQNKKYDGKDVDTIVKGNGKKTIGEMIKLRDEIVYKNASFLHPNKNNTLPFFREIRSDETFNLQDSSLTTYFNVLNKNCDQLVCRKDFEKILKENFNDFDENNLDYIIQRWVNFSF